MKGLSVLLGLLLTVFASPIVAHATSLRVVLVRWDKFRQTVPTHSDEPPCVDTDGQPSSCSPAFEICLLNASPNRRCTQPSRFGGYLTPYRLRRTIFFRSRLPGGLQNPMRFLVEKQEADPALLLSVTNVDFKPDNSLARFLIKIPWLPYDVDVAERDAKWQSYELFNKRSGITIDLSIKVFTLNYRCGAACQAAKLWDKVQPIWRRTIQGRMRFRLLKREQKNNEANKEQIQGSDSEEMMEGTVDKGAKNMEQKRDRTESIYKEGHWEIKENKMRGREKENQKTKKNRAKENKRIKAESQGEGGENETTNRRWKRTMKQEKMEKAQEEINKKNTEVRTVNSGRKETTTTTIMPEHETSETTSRTQNNSTMSTNPTTTTANTQTTNMPNQTLTTERHETTSSTVVPTTKTTSTESVTSTTTNTDQTLTPSSAITNTTTNTPTSATPQTTTTTVLSTLVPTTISISSSSEFSSTNLVSSHSPHVVSDVPDVFVDIVSSNTTLMTVAASSSTLPSLSSLTSSAYPISHDSTTTSNARALSTPHSDVIHILSTTTTSSRRDGRMRPTTKVPFYLIALLLTVLAFSICVPCMFLLFLRGRFLNRVLFF
ncbi:hypothetical protein PHET_00612 [Paragonimus heterotremus]|uniref:Uncharacterized protein n=1 Tax=Paragonimus heterotremus TaxID=100268 RepID=A0A8J4WM06_9TREM|nr:hypothetical protein PHET_00612 [Paragonimus heterotremus]